MTVLLATGNRDKVAELTALLATHQIAAVWRDDLPSPEEGGVDYAANALIKARAAAAATGLPALADDSGLEVETFVSSTGARGGPGLLTRRWADELGGWEHARAALGAYAGSRASFVSALAWVWPDGRWAVGEGRTSGSIVVATVPGFGLEPSFQADGTDVPLPALPEETRAQVHYRVRAWEALAAALGW